MSKKTIDTKEDLVAKPQQTRSSDFKDGGPAPIQIANGPPDPIQGPSAGEARHGGEPDKSGELRE